MRRIFVPWRNAARTADDEWDFGAWRLTACTMGNGTKEFRSRENRRASDPGRTGAAISVTGETIDSRSADDLWKRFFMQECLH